METTDSKAVSDQLNWILTFSRLSRGQRALAVNIPYSCSKGSLQLLIDNKGIKVEGEGE